MEKLSKTCNVLSLPIDESNVIHFWSAVPVHDIVCCTGTTITLHHKKNNYFVHDGQAIADDIRFELKRCIVMLKKALSCELVLDQSEQLKLGLLLAHEEFFVMAPKKAEQAGVRFDQDGVGQSLTHMIWSYKTTLFIYNFSNEIKLLLVPGYQLDAVYDPDVPESEQDYDQYHAYLKNYHVIEELTLSREHAQQWIEQAESLLNIVEENISKLHAKSKVR